MCDSKVLVCVEIVVISELLPGCL